MTEELGDPREQRNPNLVSQVLGIFSSRLLALLLGVAAGILVTRLLGAEGRGHYAVIITLVTIATSLGHLSIEQSQAQLYSREPDSRRALAANSTYFGVWWGSVVALITFVVVSIAGPSLLPIYSTTALVVGLLYVPIATSVLWTQQSLLLRGKITAYNIGPVLSALVLLGCLSFLALAGRVTVTSAIAVWGLSLLATLFVSGFASGNTPRAVSFKLWIRTARLGLRFHPGMAFFLLLMSLDVLILNAMTDAKIVGLYSLAVSVAALINLMTNSVANVLVARQFGGTGSEAVRATSLSARMNLLVGVGLGAGLAVVSPFLVPIVYGVVFQGSVPALLALVPGIITLAWARGIGAYFVRMNKPLLVSLLAFGALVLNVALNLILIPIWGIVGASAASSLAYFAYAVASMFAFTRLAAVPWRDLFPSAADVRRVALILRESRSKRGRKNI